MVQRKKHGAKRAATGKSARGPRRAKRARAPSERELVGLLAALDVQRAQVRARLRVLRAARADAAARAQLALPHVDTAARGRT